MKKRILIPGVLIGVVAYLASQFLSFNIGDLSIPSGSEFVSVESDSSPAQPSVSKDAQPATPESAVVDQDAANGLTQAQSLTGDLAETPPERLLLVDVVIDGDRYNVNRVTNLTDAAPSHARQPATVEEIIAMIEQAEGDKSGTRVRVSRTSEAVAAAEARLMQALQQSGVNTDQIDRRSRLVD